MNEYNDFLGAVSFGKEGAIGLVCFGVKFYPTNQPTFNEVWMKTFQSDGKNHFKDVWMMKG
jgi:hypothetical protein